ncbi:MAG: sulfotransferase, partial [Chloroflexota bacterium]
MGRRPNLFIIGAPKTGTTSLYSYLEGHPDVFMSPVKEPMYFCPDVRGGLRRRYEHGEDEADYLDLFMGAGTERYLGEASTRYLASKVAPQLIHEFEPDARIVAMVRNPVDLVHALHNERVSYGTEEITDFDAAIAADSDRMAGRRLRPGSDPLWAAYRNAALLGEQVERWFDTFGLERVHVIVFDDFGADTPGEFRRLLEFLGIDPQYQPATFEVRRSSHRRRGGPLRVALENPVARWFSHRALPAMLGRANSSRLVW